jgi:hypothetical protein
VYLHHVAAHETQALPVVSLPLSRALKAAIPLAALVTSSMLVDWRLVAIIVAFSLAAFAARAVRSDLLGDNERMVGRITDTLASGWMASALLLIAGLPLLAGPVFAVVAISYLVLASITAHLLLAAAGFLVGRDAGLLLLRFFDAVREAWLPRTRLLACSLGLVITSAETMALSVLLFAALQLEPAASMAAALLLRTTVVAGAWLRTSRFTSDEAEVIELLVTSYEATDRDVAA